jgi:hypothetical protein
MSLIELTLLVLVLISVMLMLYTIPEIAEIRSKKLISARKAAFYIAVTLIIPVLGFMLILPLIKKGSEMRNNF